MLRRLLLLSMLMLFAMPVLARKAELVDPGPIAIPAGVEEKEVVNAIKSALIARTWTVGKLSPGRVDATLYIRAHRADIRIDYDTESVRIHYVGSENLDYKQKNGKTFIHSNYVGWVNNLTADISRHLQLSTLD